MSGRAILGLALLGTQALGMAACAPSTVGGVRGYTSFAATARLERHKSQRAAEAVASCFRSTASFLHMSRFEPIDGGGQRYVLAGFGQWFEEIRFLPTPAGTTSIEVLSSANYAGKWVTMLATDRLEPLAACMAAPQ